jgi:aminoglycoside 6'-N-acetyltransferase I
VIDLLPALHIRKLRETDQPRWLELRRALWPDCPDGRHVLEMEQLLRSDGAILLAEERGGQVVGFAELSIRKDHVEGTTSAPVPYLEGWYVMPAHRGMGIGRALIRHVEEWALAAGFSEIASDAELNNPDSIRAHAHLGFREVGRTVHFVRRLKPPSGTEPGNHED